MDIKIILFPVLLGASAFAWAQTSAYNNKALLKNYALTKCLSMLPGNAEFKTDAEATAQGYLEFGSVDFQAYEDAIKLARSFVEKKYESKSGAPLNVMKCIDMFHSKELEKLASKYSKKQN